MPWNLPAETLAKPAVWCCPPLLLGRNLQRQCSGFLHPLPSSLLCLSLSLSRGTGWFSFGAVNFSCVCFLSLGPGVEALSENIRGNYRPIFFLTMSPMCSHHNYILECHFEHPKWRSINSHCPFLPTLSFYLPFLPTSSPSPAHSALLNMKLYNLWLVPGFSECFQRSWMLQNKYFIMCSFTNSILLQVYLSHLISHWPASINRYEVSALINIIMNLWVAMGKHLHLFPMHLGLGIKSYFGELLDYFKVAAPVGIPQQLVKSPISCLLIQTSPCVYFGCSSSLTPDRVWDKCDPFYWLVVSISGWQNIHQIFYL